MDEIVCPSCGKRLQYKQASLGKLMIQCPDCGELPLLDDSQEVRICDGKMAGPELPNLKIPAKEIVIRQGKVQGNKQEESIIEGFQDKLKVSAPGRGPLNPLTKAALDTNIPTVEEKMTLDWKEQSKRKAPPASLTKGRPGLGPKPTKKPPVRPQKGAPAAKAHLPFPKRFLPWHKFALAYGLAGLFLILLLVLAINKYFVAPKEATLVIRSEKTWSQAYQSYLEGHLFSQEAMNSRAKRDRQQYEQKLRLAQGSYQKALEYANLFRQERMEEIRQSKRLSVKEAEDYYNTNEVSYQKEIQQWQQEAQIIQKQLDSLTKGKK